MKRKLILIGALGVAVGLSGCAGMSDTEQRTLSGAAIGTAAGAAVGAITGQWAWAAGGAAIGAGAGFLYDREQQQRQAEQDRAFQKGVQAGKAQAQQK